MRWFALAVLAAAPLPAGELKPQTLEAFDRYIRQTEQRLDARKSFLWADESAERAQRLSPDFESPRRTDSRLDRVRVSARGTT